VKAVPSVCWCSAYASDGGARGEHGWAKTGAQHRRQCCQDESQPSPAAIGLWAPAASREEAMPARVLVAEDEWLIAVTLCRQLESQGYEVVAVVGTGAAAVAACHQQEPDLVLMDIQMPQMDGLAATRTLMETCPHPVVVVTGNATLREAAEEAGAMGYAVKPLLAHEIPGVMTRAQRRFRWFMASRREASDSAGAVPSWRKLLAAARHLQQAEGDSEERAFERLRELADRDGRSLAEAARRVVSSSEDAE
jgi:AmiR/NasT family two-component response regulator